MVSSVHENISVLNMIQTFCISSVCGHLKRSFSRAYVRVFSVISALDIDLLLLSCMFFLRNSE